MHFRESYKLAIYVLTLSAPEATVNGSRYYWVQNEGWRIICISSVFLFGSTITIQRAQNQVSKAIISNIEHQKTVANDPQPARKE